MEIIINKDNIKHIADIKNIDNVVIEVQHSYLSAENIAEREKFYDNMIWLLDGTTIYNDDSETFRQKIIEYFITANKYVVIKVTAKFWSNMNKKKYIDDGYTIYEVIKYTKNNYYICRNITYVDFLKINYKEILKYDLEKTTEILYDFTNKMIKDDVDYEGKLNYCYDEYYDSEKTEFYYDEICDCFYGKGTYNVRRGLFKIGYKFNKNNKKYIFDDI